ncbi:MAG: hypothetical protein JST54_03955 [Deltaproteobacteria bacterium]|nr:hypothetical protein [Deltaproteobacteria bacterium]
MNRRRRRSNAGVRARVAPDVAATATFDSRPRRAPSRASGARDPPADFEKPHHDRDDPEGDARSREFWSAMGGMVGGHGIAAGCAFMAALAFTPFNDPRADIPASAGAGLFFGFLAEIIVVPLVASLFATWEAPSGASLWSPFWRGFLVHAGALFGLGAFATLSVPTAIIGFALFVAVEFVGVPKIIVAGLNLESDPPSASTPAPASHAQATDGSPRTLAWGLAF